MVPQRSPSRHKLAISRQLLLALVGLFACASACSAGETGLVLGRPLPQSVAGSGGVTTASGGAAASTGPGGTSATAGSGGQPAAAGASAGTSSMAGDAGAAGAGDEPAWIEERCTPSVDFSNNDPTSKGQLFTAAAPNPQELVVIASHAACRALYRAAEEVPTVTRVGLVVEDYAGVAGTIGAEMRLSTRHLASFSEPGVSVAVEIRGILHFTTSLVYQHLGSGTAPVWLVTGIADFVRLQAHLVDRPAATKGGNYDDNSKTTARFLEYLRSRNPDIVYRLNQRLTVEAGPWTDDAFVELTGSDLSALWSDYQATLPE